jgi:hypothetical protein
LPEFFVFFLKYPLSSDNAKPLPRNKDKEYSLQVLIGGLQPKGLLSRPGGPGMDKNINKSPALQNQLEF